MERALPALVHQLNNHLAVILGNASLGSPGSAVDWGSSPSSSSGALAREARACSRLVNLLARLRPGGRERVAPTDVRSVVNDAAVVLRPISRSAGIDLRVRPARTAALVRCDDARLLQAVVAMTALDLPLDARRGDAERERDAPRARLSLSGRDGRACVRAVHRRETLPVATGRASDPLGFVVELARRLGGRARSRTLGPHLLGVELRLPATIAEEEAGGAAGVHPSGRVLVVDRESPVVAALLESHGHRVRAVRDAAGAFDELEREPVDVALVAIELRMADGRPLWRALEGRARHTVRILARETRAEEGDVGSVSRGARPSAWVAIVDRLVQDSGGESPLGAGGDPAPTG